MATKEGKNKVDLSKVLESLDVEFRKNLAVKDVFSRTYTSLKDIEQGGQKSEKTEKARTLIFEMKKNKTYSKLTEECKQVLIAFADQETVIKKQGDDSKVNPKRSSPAPSSPKQKCPENQAVDIGRALAPTPSKQSPTSTRKESNETEKLKKEFSSPSKQTPAPTPTEIGETENLTKEIQKLKSDLEDERKGRNISEDRLKQINELEEENKKKDDKYKKLEQEARDLALRLEEEKVKRSKTESDQMVKQNLVQHFEEQVNDYSSEVYSLKTQIKDLENTSKNLEKEKSKIEKLATKNIEHLQDVLKEEKRKSDDQYKKLLAERDDLRDRFSKLAGKKLQEQNADIADLSDPNRAMKLSEKFGQLYDDEWTNAFEFLTDKKGGVLQLRDAIDILLRLLQECWTFCNNMMETQMESLHYVFLHPDQNPANYVHQAKKVLDKPRITSKDTQTLKDLRRRIGVSPSVLEDVKQALLVVSKSWGKEKKGYDKKHIDACAPYLQKCAEICWLMALHDPPLFMKMEVKQGEKLDLNIYTVYSASGTTIDFLVWPPLYNGKDGGLLSKGVAEPLRVVSKKK